jgi:hypothetical protein
MIPHYWCKGVQIKRDRAFFQCPTTDYRKGQSIIVPVGLMRVAGDSTKDITK